VAQSGLEDARDIFADRHAPETLVIDAWIVNLTAEQSACAISI